MYRCRTCGVKFRNQRRIHSKTTKKLWNEYVFHKQTIRELSNRYHHDKETIRKILGSYDPPEKVHHPRPVHLLVDGVYFGKRTQSGTQCLIVFRDGLTHEDLWWKFTDTESTWAYAQGLGALKHLGYNILSVTADGLGCIRSAFQGLPYQMCLVHMERLIIRGTTRSPKTKAGEILLALARSIHSTSKITLQRRLAAYWRMYNGFLREKTIHPDGGWSYTHEELRRATLSFRRLFPYLFTYEKNVDIPKNTNSLEGHFSHIKDLLRIHRGVSKEHREKILHTILLNSSVSLEKQKKA